MKRFTGTAVALFCFALVLGVYWWGTGTGQVLEEQQPELFQFEPDDLVGIKIERPGNRIVLTQTDSVWTLEGKTWRPSRSMVRRVGHQLHDLSARAVVAESADNLDEYGLGEDSILVELTLKEGRTVSFRAGDPNPTSVSWYIRPLPGKDVFVVKKAAIDYFRMDVESFREPRVALIDANEAEHIQATVDGREIEVVRVGPKTWEMKQPVAQRADRQRVRSMLGRTGALKASEFVADAPTDLSEWGLSPAPHRIKISMTGGNVVTLLVAEPTLEDERPVTFVYREEDDSVYKVKGGFLEAFRFPIEMYRDRLILGRQEGDVTEITVAKGTEKVTVRESTGDWRWPDDAAIPGSTPRRLAGLVKDIKALAFHEDGVNGSGLNTDSARVTFSLGEEEIRLVLGKTWEIPAEDERSRPDQRQYLQVEGNDTVFEVDWALNEVVGDVLREYSRKLKKDAEKTLQTAMDADEE